MNVKLDPWTFRDQAVHPLKRYLFYFASVQIVEQHCLAGFLELLGKKPET